MPEKRKECWVMLPQRYDIRCDLCGGVNLNWSEFEHLISMARSLSGYA